MDLMTRRYWLSCDARSIPDRKWKVHIDGSPEIAKHTDMPQVGDRNLAASGGWTYDPLTNQESAANRHRPPPSCEHETRRAETGIQASTNVSFWDQDLARCSSALTGFQVDDLAMVGRESQGGVPRCWLSSLIVGRV